MPRPNVFNINSPMQNIDNGAGTTADYTLFYCRYPVKVHSAKIVYDDATTGTVAAATCALGVAVGGATLVAATALGNSKAVGTTTAMTLLLKRLPAETSIFMRHTGIAATAAGQYHVQLEVSYEGKGAQFYA